MHNATVKRIIRAYDDPIVRAYCWARFGILRQRFLDEIGQYLPEAGPVLDIGCGFGLFSLYYAATGPRRLLRGLDLDTRRIALAPVGGRAPGARQCRLRGGRRPRLQG
jgi:2-polyprenyl-3-methyl-5-hydroxy-6-metoxy-1,4-benzoquinol methylase